MYLVGGLEHEWIMTFHMLGVIPSDELHHFSEGLVNHQPVLFLGKNTNLSWDYDKP